MGDIVGSAFREFVAMLQSAVAQPGPWTAVGVLIVLVCVVAGIRSKMAAAWIWLPGLALVAYYAVWRLRLR